MLRPQPLSIDKAQAPRLAITSGFKGQPSGGRQKVCNLTSGSAEARCADVLIHDLTHLDNEHSRIADDG